MDEEQHALDRLSKYLSAAGESLTVLRRPDQEDRSQRAVDFEIAWNGTTVGVEITSASTFIEDFLPIDSVEKPIEDGLRSTVDRHGLGSFVLRVRYHERPKKRDAAKLVNDVVAGMTAALLADPISDVIELGDPPYPIESVSLTRYSRTRNLVGSISTAVAWFVDGEVDRFIEALIKKKASQGGGYDVMWIVIFARTPIHETDDLASGFERYRAKLPPNWKRVFYILGPNVAEVLAA